MEVLGLGLRGDFPAVYETMTTDDVGKELENPDLETAKEPEEGLGEVPLEEAGVAV